MENIDELTECPVCHNSWVGDEIPKEYRHLYGNSKNFSRLIGIEDWKKYDGVSYWECPDCKTIWNRFTNKIVDDYGIKNGI